MGTDTFKTSRLPIAVPRYFSFYIHTHTLPLSLSLSLSISLSLSLVLASPPSLTLACPARLLASRFSARGGDMSRKQRRGKKWATSCRGAVTESRGASSYQRTGGPRLVCAHTENSDLVWHWHVYGWWAQASDFARQRLHPCSGGLSFGALGLETTPADETRFLLGGTWTLLRHASPSPALCLCYYISYNFSRASSVTLGMAMPDLLVCPPLRSEQIWISSQSPEDEFSRLRIRHIYPRCWQDESWWLWFSLTQEISQHLLLVQMHSQRRYKKRMASSPSVIDNHPTTDLQKPKHLL